MATQIILSKLTNLVIPDEIIFDIDKMVYHAKHVLNYKKVINELDFFGWMSVIFNLQIFECINMLKNHEKEIEKYNNGEARVYGESDVEE